MTEQKRFFKCSRQDFIAIDAISRVSDFGWDIGVTMKDGTSVRIDGSLRERFLPIIEALTFREKHEAGSVLFQQRCAQEAADMGMVDRSDPTRCTPARREP